MRVNLPSAFLALVALVPLLPAQAEGCSGFITGIGLFDPPTPGNPIGVVAVVTPEFAFVTSENCEADCKFAWDVQVVFTSGAQPITPNSVEVCGTSGVSGTWICWPATLNPLPPAPPFEYSFKSVATNYPVSCPGRFSLKLQWNAGLGYFDVVNLDMACEACGG